MPNSLVPAIIKMQNQVFAGIAPSEKITPMGYLNMLLGNTLPNIVSASTENDGHIRDVKIKYRPRATKGKSVTTDDCSIQANPTSKEAILPSLMFRKNGTFISYDEIRNMEKEASATVFQGRPAPPMGVMQALWEILVYKGNGLLQDVNDDLLTIQAANFGKNAESGLTTARTINFPLSTTSNPLTQGLTALSTEVKNNEIRPDNYSIVGSGL